MEKDKKVNFFGYTFTLTEDTCIGKPNKFHAKAVDRDGREFMIIWDVKEGYTELGNDNLSACDWDNPSEVYPIK